MSLEIILIPLAIALVTQAKSKAKENTPNNSSHQVAVETRMKNLELLQNAMRNIGCTTTMQEGEITASLNATNFTFKKFGRQGFPLEHLWKLQNKSLGKLIKHMELKFRPKYFERLKSVHRSQE